MLGNLRPVVDDRNCRKRTTAEGIYQIWYHKADFARNILRGISDLCRTDFEDNVARALYIDLVEKCTSPSGF